jgi:uncharacterized protein (TIGR02996 family)
MDPADGFLDAICAAPDDDTPRLVFADWLEEHGEPERAEFIRVQCRIAREPLACVTGRPLPGYGDFTARCRCPGCSLRRREYAASRRHIVWDWHGTWAGTDDWRRGFVYRVRAPCADFLLHAGVLFSRQPVEEVTLSDRGPGDPLSVHSVGFLWLPWPRPRDAAPGTHFWTPHSAPDVLPWPLYQAVCECRDKNVAEAEDDCRRWLSAGCVRWGREEARKLRHARQEAR